MNLNEKIKMNGIMKTTSILQMQIPNIGLAEFYFLKDLKLISNCLECEMKMKMWIGIDSILEVIF